MPDEPVVTVYEGRHLSMVQRGRWEYATRKTATPAVGIVAITDAGKIVLVEQYRLPVGHRVIELPAGLTGDVAGAEDEPLVAAAQRELLEETGYTAREWVELCTGYSSPGLTDESIVLFLARGLKKEHVGGGDATEDITVHEIAPDKVLPWLKENHLSLDFKLLAGLYMARPYLNAGQRQS